VSFQALRTRRAVVGRDMPDLRPVFFVVGLMIAALGMAMFAPMLVDLAYNDRSWRAFGISGILTTLLGAALALATYTPKPERFC